MARRCGKVLEIAVRVVVLLAVAGTACGPKAAGSSGDATAGTADSGAGAGLDGGDADAALELPPPIDSLDGVDAGDTGLAPDASPVALACPVTGEVVQPGAKPAGAACSPACAPGYPCKCGSCPWVQTPPMVFPRYRAGAVWTGKEVLVFGGSTTPYPGGCCVGFTGEKWNPSSGGGFKLMNFPSLAFHGGVPEWAEYTTVWTGKEAFVRLRDNDGTPQNNWMLRYDPVADSGSWVDMAKAPPGMGGHMRVAGGKVVSSGLAAKQVSPPPKRVFGLFDPATSSWDIVAWPDFFEPVEEYPMHSCTVAVGDNFFMYGVTDPFKPEYKQDPKWPSTLKLHVPTKTWSLIAQAPFLSKCYGPGFIVTPHFGATATGFLVWGSQWVDDKPKSYAPMVGGYYDVASDSWTLMKDPDFARPSGADLDIPWNGKVFAFRDLVGKEPKGPGLVGNKLLAAGYAAFYDLASGWQIPPSVGVPNDKRGHQAPVFGNNELFLLGGINGPDWANVVHATGIRYHLPKELSP